MTILFYRYNSICEPDIMNHFRSLNIDVVEETAEITNKNISPSQCDELVSRAIAAHRYIGMRIAETERIHTLNTLAQYFNVDLYTRSDSSDLTGVHVHNRIKTHTEMQRLPYNQLGSKLC